ncbi:S9 family peptidase [Hyphococcus luteus]|uniref:S9 family peptidase n=1 Tax=Hyphococcus luteus TaxID=2058213 RepID=A0A2S7KB66_9PROT|nr:S9 family peptidase [Marinicaulis flavus]PQA89755.1 S9 family peptidase [Marinicaulis flavus]
MRFFVLAAAAVAIATPLAAQEKTAVMLDDIHKLVDISGPAFSPDGEFIAYTASTHNLKLDETVSDLWRVSWEGDTAQLTHTPTKSEWAPSYGGDSIAYLSDAAEKDETQVFIMPAGGGEARQVTKIKGGVSDYALSPDGKTLIAVAEVGPSVGADPDKPKPIVITRFKFKEDYRGYVDGRRYQFFRVDVASGEAEQITETGADYYLPSWSPDGSQIAFVAANTDREDRNYSYDVYVMAPRKGANPRKISTFEGADADPGLGVRPRWSPDGDKLVWLQNGEDKWIYYAPFQLTYADLESGEVKPLAHIDRWMYAPHWAPDSKSVYALVEQDRDTWAAKIDLATEEVTYLTSGPRFGFDLAVSSNGRVAVLDGEENRPYELGAVEEGVRPLTHHNDWLENRRLAEMRDISFRSGKHEIHGLLILPLGYEEGERYPVIARLHGGPVYQFSHEFIFDWQYYAANGYAVLAVNPRGSSGRGFDFAKAIYADWGNVDVKDISAGIDYAIDIGIADPERIGVGGWSYGGILTDYMIASDKRIKAAVSGAGMANFLAGYGADQYMLEYEEEVGLPWRDRKAFERISYPFLQADRITAATMFQCAGADLNVPCIGSEQMYLALRSREIDTELVVYPGENHGLTRPSFLYDRLERNLAWYDKYLKAGE